MPHKKSSFIYYRMRPVRTIAFGDLKKADNFKFFTIWFDQCYVSILFFINIKQSFSMKLLDPLLYQSVIHIVLPVVQSTHIHLPFELVS